MVARVPQGGGTKALIASSSTSSSVVMDMAVDSTSVYRLESLEGNGGRVMKAPRNGGASTLLSNGGDRPTAIAVDSTSVYWTDRGAGVVYKLTPK